MSEERQPDRPSGTDPIPASGQAAVETDGVETDGVETDGAAPASGDGPDHGGVASPLQEQTPTALAAAEAAPATAEPPEPTQPEPTQPEPTPLERAEQRIAELQKRAESAATEAKDNRNKMLRVAADFENFRKRSSREAEEARARGQQRAISLLLPVFDNLERATAHVDATMDAASVADGLRLVVKQFIEALGKLDVQRVEALGAPFDPTVHESIHYEHHDTIAAGLVAKELQPGYKQGASLLRPALVVVSKGPAPKEATAPREETASKEEAVAAPPPAPGPAPAGEAADEESKTC